MNHAARPIQAANAIQRQCRAAWSNILSSTRSAPV
jgi:hypothetical protein